MMKKSFKQTILLNIGAFILVAILETLSMLISKDTFDSNYSFMKWNLSFAMYIMGVIWVNHFILIPFILDKKWYILYGVLLVVTIISAGYIRGYHNGKIDIKSISKMFFFLFYTTGTGMAAFFLRRNRIIQKEHAEKEKLQRETELKYLKEQVNPHFLFNSLNSIYALSRQQSPETPELVMQLSELMRYQLESSKKDAVLLKEELELEQKYAKLEADANGETELLKQLAETKREDLYAIETKWNDKFLADNKKYKKAECKRCKKCPCFDPLKKVA